MLTPLSTAGPAFGEGSQYGAALSGGGFCTLADRGAGVSATTPASGTLVLTYRRSPSTFTATQIRSGSSTAAGATPTLIRLGLYSVAANGDLTLIASTINDTTLYGAANTAYGKALSSSVSLVRGQWYAYGMLIVSGASMPALVAPSSQAYSSLVLSTAPRLSGARAGQTDLPASITSANVAVSNQGLWAEVLP